RGGLDSCGRGLILRLVLARFMPVFRAGGVGAGSERVDVPTLLALLRRNRYGPAFGTFDRLPEVLLLILGELLHSHGELVAALRVGAHPQVPIRGIAADVR